MKKVLIGVLGLVLLLAAGIFTAPLLFDANQYKPVIEAQVKAAMGYEISMKGEIKLSLFPRPKLTVSDVALFNNSKNFASAEMISAYPKLQPLFHRKLQVDAIKVQKPVLTLVKNEAGKSWVNSGDVAKIPVNDKLDLNITTVELEGGRIDYKDEVEKISYNLSDINLTTGVPSLAGPVSFEGAIKFKNLPVTLKGKIFYSDAQKISVNAKVLDSEIFYEGSRNFGAFSIKSTDIAPLVEAFELEDLRQWEKLPINIKGDLASAKDKFDLDNMEFTIGETRGEGDLSMAYDDKIEANADLKFGSINLDQLIPKTSPLPSGGDGGGRNSNTSASLTQPSPEGRGLEQKEIIADLDITADSVTYGGVVYKNLDIKATTEDNVVSLQPLKFDFPTSGSAEVTGVLVRDTSGRVFEGDIISESNNLRDILKSFKVNLANVKPEMLKDFKLVSKLVVNVRDHLSIELSKTALNIDGDKFNGNISADIEKLPNIEITGAISAINLDKYLIAEKLVESETNEKRRETGATDDKPFRITWLEELPIQGVVNISVGNFTYDGDAYNNLRLRANFKPEILNVDEITAAGKKIQIAGKGSVLAYKGKKPKINIDAANIGKINMADFMKNEVSPTAKAIDKTRWDKKTFDLSFIRKLDMDFEANILSLIHNDLVFDNIAVKGYIESGKLVIDKSSGNMFGGKIYLNGNVEATAVPAVSFAYTGSNVDVGKVIDALTGNNRVSGKANFSGSLSTSGIYQLAMINNLTGTFTLASNSLVVRGFDLDGLSGQIINTNNIADVTAIARTVSGDDAVTYLKTINGGLVFENGVARTQDQGFEMKSASGPGAYTGKADLVNWKMESFAKFKLMTPDGKTPTAVIHIFGPPDEPIKELNLDEIKRYISGRGAKMLLNDIPPADTAPVIAGPDNMPSTAPVTKEEARQAAIERRKAIARAKRAGWVQPVVR